MGISLMYTTKEANNVTIIVQNFFFRTVKWRLVLQTNNVQFYSLDLYVHQDKVGGLPCYMNMELEKDSSTTYKK